MEGHELAVIEGMQGCRVLPDVMCAKKLGTYRWMISQRLAPLGNVYDISSHVNAFFHSINRSYRYLLSARGRSSSVVTLSQDLFLGSAVGSTPVSRWSSPWKERKALVMNAQTVQDVCIEIVDMHRTLDNVIREVVPFHRPIQPPRTPPPAIHIVKQRG